MCYQSRNPAVVEPHYGYEANIYKDTKGRPTAPAFSLLQSQRQGPCRCPSGSSSLPPKHWGHPSQNGITPRAQKAARGKWQSCYPPPGLLIRLVIGCLPPPKKLRRASAPLLRPDPYPAFGTPALPSLPPHPCRLGGGRPGSAQPGKWRRAPAGSSRPPVAPAVPGHSVVQAAGPTYLSRMGGAAKASSPRGGVER